MTNYAIARGVSSFLNRDSEFMGVMILVPKRVQTLYRLPERLWLGRPDTLPVRAVKRSGRACRRLLLKLDRLHLDSAPDQATGPVRREMLKALGPFAAPLRCFTQGVRRFGEAQPEGASARRGVFVLARVVSLLVPRLLRRHFLFPAEIYLPWSKAKERGVAAAHRRQLLRINGALLRGRHDEAVALAFACLSSMPVSANSNPLLTRERLCAQVAGWARWRRVWRPTRAESHLLANLRHIGPATTVELAVRLRPLWHAHRLLTGNSPEKTAAAAVKIASAGLKHLANCGLVVRARQKWRVAYPGPTPIQQSKPHPISGALRPTPRHAVGFGPAWSERNRES